MSDRATVEVGQIWSRRVASEGVYVKNPAGEEIQIEETGLVQRGGRDPVHVRAVHITGPRKGEKVQWAESYITRDFLPIGDS